MKMKKTIAGICAAAISISVLTLTASAASASFSETAGKAPVSGSLSVNSRQVVATASISDNPANYQVAQARVSLLEYTTRNNSNGMIQKYSTNTVWGTGGAGCNAFPPDGYSITKANSYNEFNIDSQLYSGNRYNLAAQA